MMAGNIANAPAFFFWGGGEFADYFHYYARPCTLHEPGITSYYSVTSNYAYQVTRKPRL